MEVRLIRVGRVGNGSSRRKRYGNGRAGSLNVRVTFRHSAIDPRDRPRPSLSFTILRAGPRDTSSTGRSVCRRGSRRKSFIVHLPFFLARLLFAREKSQNGTMSVGVISLRPLSRSIRRRIRLILHVEAFRPGARLYTTNARTASD